MSKQSWHLAVAVLAFLMTVTHVGAQDASNKKPPQDAPKKKATQDAPEKKVAQDASKKKTTQDAPKKKTPQVEPAAKPATHRVTKSPFKIEVKLDGVFESAEMTEVILQPEAWAIFKVVKAVEQGTRAKKGRPLVWLETKKIDEEIKGLEYARELAQLALKQTERELQLLKKAVPMDLASAERSRRIADEELKYFLRVDRPLSEKSAAYSLKSSKERMEYAEEELRQLEKMYKADDLTEETEEIILKRARRSVEYARFYLDMTKVQVDRELKVSLPRQQEQMTEATKRQAILTEQTRITLPMLQSQKSVGLEKLKFDQKKADDRLAKLKKDREQMIVKSPADGTVYYGKCVRGKWSGGSTIALQLQPAGNLMPNQVFMTVVRPEELFVRTDVSEKDLQNARPGVTGKIVPTASPDASLSAKVQRVSPIPITAGQFDGRIAITEKKRLAMLMPGMACSVKLVAYEKKDAIAVPVSAVFAEELDEDKRYVYLSKPEGKHEKRPVTVGKKTEKKIEILRGLKPGDEILLQKPKEEKKQ